MCMYVVTINAKELMNFKESKEGYMGVFEERKKWGK